MINTAFPLSGLVRNLASICKWKVRACIESGGSLYRAVQLLPVPKHIQTFLTTPGHDKPIFEFQREEQEAMEAEEDGGEDGKGSALMDIS